MILTMVMWIKAPAFGILPECNSNLKFVFLFAVNVDATTSGRIVSLCCTSIITLFYVYTTCREIVLSTRWPKSVNDIPCSLVSVICKRLKGSDASDNVAHTDPGKHQTEQIVLSPTFASSPITEEPVTYGARMPVGERDTEGHIYNPQRLNVSSTRPRSSISYTLRSTTSSSRLSRDASGRRQWVHALDGTLIGTIVFQTIVFAYFISVNESYILRNPTDSGNDVWGFGQVSDS